MDNNIRILLVNCDELESVLTSLNFKEITKVHNGKAAIKEFVTTPYAVSFIHELPADEEQALISSMLEINPEHYIITLTDVISPEKIQNFVKSGAKGILSKPFNTQKIKTELDKFDLLSAEEDSARKAS